VRSDKFYDALVYWGLARPKAAEPEGVSWIPPWRPVAVIAITTAILYGVMIAVGERPLHALVTIIIAGAGGATGAAIGRRHRDR
jgi:hypothetical protein